ncbi:MAG: DUF1800 domain-containing protein [Gemmatimonadetes bacterium]|nr:DUF1800 domain-containing protein [Gemmatimonadota bacterium]
MVATLTLYPLSPLASQALAARDSALHVLNRLAYGPRPGEVERIARMGVLRWIEQQLAPERIPNPVLARREREFKLLDYDAPDLARRYAAAVAERVRRQQASTADDTMPPRRGPVAEFRRLAGQLQQLAVTRAALSERQLQEVMADFWTNHFNVFSGKGADRFLTPSYVEETVRPHALGRFEDLLIATAKSPAMLFYLDNAQSVAPGSTPPILARGGRRRMPAGLEQRLPKGINENYARELLELHTLGVDGGYVQQDVIEVARILTGWGIARPRDGAGFEYRDWAHDQGDKLVLGVRFHGGGMEEGIRLLKLLAGHHATMHHISRKLCARFVSDEPPDGCVDDAVDAWHRSRGDIREILRAIFRSRDFWAPPALRSKVKTPLEFIVSAVRAVGADPDTTPRLAQVVARLGQPLYLQSAPTGYPETQEDWVNSGALLARMNVAVGLAGGRLPGVTVDLDRVVPVTSDYAQLVDAVSEVILGGTMSGRTRDVIGRQLSAVSDPRQARALAIGLAVGGPEFQRQ